MQTMTITWNNSRHRGQMRLNMDTCFPCSASWLRKLLRTTVDRSDHPGEYRAELVIYLNELQDDAYSKTEREKVEEEIRQAGYAIERAEKYVGVLTEREKLLREYVSAFVCKTDRDNTYLGYLKEAREQLKEAKSAYRSEVAKGRAAKCRLKKMDAGAKNIRECLAVLGQEV